MSTEVAKQSEQDQYAKNVAEGVEKLTFSFELSKPPSVAKHSLVYSSLAVDIYDVESDSVESFMFNDPLAPYGVHSGYLMRFKDWSPENTSSIDGVVQSVKNKRMVSKIKHREVMEDDWDDRSFPSLAKLFLTIPLAVFVDIKTGIAVIPELVSGAGMVLAIIVFAMMAVLLTAMVVLGGVLVTILQHVVHNAVEEYKYSKNSTKMIALNSSRSHKESYFFVGSRSNVARKIIKTSDEVANLFYRKMKLLPDGPELQLWSYHVEKLINLQEKLDGGFPMKLIPLMSEDVIKLIADLEDKIEQAAADELQRKHDEAKALSHGRFMSGEDESARNESKAILAGASAYLNSGVKLKEIE